MLSTANEWRGVWTAMITPFNSKQEIDWESWDKMVAYQVSSAIHGMVLFGSTGEASTLELDEKVALVERTMTHVKDTKIKVIASVGSSSTKQSVEWGVACQKAGAHGLLVSTSAYNKPTLPGHIDYFKQIATASNLPICLYHIPGRTAQALSFSQLIEVCQAVPEVKAIKEATCDLHLFTKLKLHTDCALLSGDDPTFLASMAVGGDGVISVCSNLYPKIMIDIWTDFQTNKNTAAVQNNMQLLKVFDLLACESNPGPIKAAMAIHKYCDNRLRSPLFPISEQNYAMLAEELPKVL